jgi:hypothetical protein
MELSAMDYENSLAHYGILRKSGRYPWGSGKNPLQRSKTFLDILKGHEKDGMSQSEIAALYDKKKEGFPFSVSDLRAIKSRAVQEVKEDRIRQAQRLKDKGYGYSEIARRMSGPEKTYNESSIRSLLEPGRLDREDTHQKIADMLKRQVEEKGYIDVGAHVERDLPLGDNPETRMGISKDKFNTALSMLKEEGYGVATFPGPQVGTGENTTYRMLLKLPRKNMTQQQIQREAFLNRDKMQLISEKSTDGGKTWQETVFKPPLNISPTRVGIRYKEDGGTDADGVLYVRPGVPDVSLGKSRYAQVRVAVGGTHFLKGMAVYKDDLPPGVDILFNTNKSNTGNKLDAMKPLKKVKVDGKDTKEVDWTNPFGAFPKFGGQLLNDKGQVTSAMNRLNEEGDWNTWSRKLSSQFLSKQNPKVAKSQLDLTYERRVDEYTKIKELTNPLIKRKLLESFSDEVDSSAVYLKAANMPRQATKVLLPVPGMKPDEVYAPSHNNGERVALVRFPHAGTFEIPELTVNNNNRHARALFGVGKEGHHPPDAVGIHPKVAEKLSGADFDGDHVVLIPNRHGKVESRPSLERLKGFDPQDYKVPEEGQPGGRKTVKDDQAKGYEMGKITNLISDMTIKGASDAEISDAVRHSMVVIDSQKHNLDYKASERDHNIPALKQKYQGGANRGASTLLTKATAQERANQRKDAPSNHPGHSGKGVTRTAVGTIDNVTGKKVYVLKDNFDANGNRRTFRSKKLAETDNAFSLIDEHGGQPIERLYAEHSNRLKRLADEARLELIRTEPVRRNASSAKVYHAEVASLKGQLNTALLNAPRERKAQNLANQIVAQRRRANPDMEKSELKKIKGQALEEARARTGAKKDRITINDREWEAIQAGAISIQNLKDILTHTDVDKLRERATPRDNTVMTTVMQSRARQMRSSGATYAEIADALGIPESTLQSSIGEA